MHSDPEATSAFSDAMISNSAHASAAIAEFFPFSKYKSVVDLGGGVGTLLIAIARRHAGLRAVLFEVEDLREEADAYLRANNMSERIEFVSGSFLENVPPDIDVYLVKNSLWNWDDSRCLQIMKNVRSAIGDDLSKRFVVIEYVISDDNASWSTLYDLQILNLPGGRARTRSEYEVLFEQSGFALEHMLFAEDQTLLVAQPISLGL